MSKAHSLLSKILKSNEGRQTSQSATSAPCSWSKTVSEQGLPSQPPLGSCAGMVDPGSYARGESRAQLLVTKDMAETVLAR